MKGKSFTFLQGLPQGAVLSPTLFLVFINDVVNTVGTDTTVSLFADDLAVWSSSTSIETARTNVESACNSIAEWSNEWLMQLSIDKCEISLFSMDAKHADKRPEVRIGDELLGFNPTPCFLGVTYDRRLTFGPHVQRTVAKTKKRITMLKALSGTDWGFGKDLLTTTYVAMIRSQIEYGSPAWMPWIGKGNMEKLERIQLEAARKITGALKSTPTEAVLAEANLPKIEDRARVLAVVAYERSLRCARESPRFQIATAEVGCRLKKQDWRSAAKEGFRQAMGGAEVMESFPPLQIPWLDLSKVKIEEEGTRMDSEEACLAMAAARLEDNEEYDYVVYTDGSATEGKAYGGAGVVVTRGNMVNPTVVDRK